MDTTKTEELLKDFESEIKNISEITSILQSIKVLHEELSSSSLEHRNDTEALKAISLELSKLTVDLSSKIEAQESLLKDGLKNQVSILKDQTKVIEDTVQSQLHLALTRYETFVRGELISLKDRLKLNFKELSNQDVARAEELKNILDQSTAKIMGRITLFFGLSILIFSGLTLFLIIHS